MIEGIVQQLFTEPFIQQKVRPAFSHKSLLDVASALLKPAKGWNDCEAKKLGFEKPEPVEVKFAQNFYELYQARKDADYFDNKLESHLGDATNAHLRAQEIVMQVSEWLVADDDFFKRFSFAALQKSLITKISNR